MRKGFPWLSVLAGLAGLAVGMVTGVLVIVWLMEDPPTMEAVGRTVTAIGAVAAASVGLFALFFAREQLEHNRQTSRMALAADLFRSYNTPEFAQLAHRAVAFANVEHGDRDARWREWESDPEKRHAVAQLWNFLETIGLMYNRGLVDRVVTREVFEEVSSAYWSRTGWLIERAMKGDPPWDGPPEWIAMENDFRRHRGEAPITKPDAGP